MVQPQPTGKFGVNVKITIEDGKQILEGTPEELAEFQKLSPAPAAPPLPVVIGPATRPWWPQPPRVQPFTVGDPPPWTVTYEKRGLQMFDHQTGELLIATNNRSSTAQISS